MVGVPGKYKGCETCRRRRVACTNERPHCRRCVSGGRECEGYDRGTVFITGTPEGRGRVTSHPKRVGPRKKQTAKLPRPVTEQNDDLQSPSKLLAGVTIQKSAWDHRLDLSGSNNGCSSLIAALHTSLHTIVHLPETTIENRDDQDFGIALPQYSPLEMHHNAHVNAVAASAPHWINGQCLLCQHGIQGGSWSTDSYCNFLFEKSSPSTSWRIATELVVQRLGAANFTLSPHHQFFVRIYRPIAVGLALLNRKETFLSGSEWMEVPWTNHRKSSLDTLFDVILRLPPLLTQTDDLIPQRPSMERRDKAQGLLQSCGMLEMQFSAWLGQTVSCTEELYSINTTTSSLAPVVYTFHDELSAFTNLYYWMSQMMFHHCIENLCDIVQQPMPDFLANIWRTQPTTSLQVDQEQYRDGRQLASKICRGLDSALSCTTQPDLLVAPMTVAMDFYHGLKMTSLDGTSESMELQLFRGRLIAKGHDVVPRDSDTQDTVFAGTGTPAQRALRSGLSASTSNVTSSNVSQHTSCLPVWRNSPSLFFPTPTKSQLDSVLGDPGSASAGRH